MKEETNQVLQHYHMALSENITDPASSEKMISGKNGSTPHFILQMIDVSKIYPSVNALYKVNFRVREGEWLSIMGPSGSGKTTLMNIIGCMDTASEGKVLLDGEDISLKTVAELTEIRRDKIGLVFQQFHLVNYLTALENIMLAQYYHSLPDLDEAMEALEEVGLKDRAGHLPNQLSGGEQQRVCIARALINHPRLILADEPTGNLDEKNEMMAIDILDRLHRRGSTIIVVTHDPEVGDAAERKIILNHGILESDIIRASRGSIKEMMAGREIPISEGEAGHLLERGRSSIQSALTHGLETTGNHLKDALAEIDRQLARVSVLIPGGMPRVQEELERSRENLLKAAAQTEADMKNVKEKMTPHLDDLSRSADAILSIAKEGASGKDDPSGVSA